MKERELDFLTRQLVRVKIFCDPGVNERLIASRLPEEYFLNNGVLSFPAGYLESYFVNGKEYNINGDRTVEQQTELIIQDLMGDGFSDDEAKEFTHQIKIRDGGERRLSFEDSEKWLEKNPEFRNNAFVMLEKIKSEIEAENNEAKKGKGKRK